MTIACEQKMCSGCKTEYPRSADFFHRDRSAKDGLHGYCKQCANQRVSAHQRADSKRGNAYRRKWAGQNRDRVENSRLKSRFGISLSEYNSMLESQGGVCAICGKPETSKDKRGVRKLAVDHDHATGKVRGLLCYTCNSGLGYFREDKSALASAITYLIERAG